MVHGNRRGISSEAEARTHARISVPLHSGFVSREKKPEVALNLLEQYFSTGDTFGVNAAYSAQAEAYKTLGRYDDAITAYRRALLWKSTHPYSLTRSYLELPYLIAILGKTEHFEEAITILQNPESKLVFPVDEFM